MTLMPATWTSAKPQRNTAVVLTQTPTVRFRARHTRTRAIKHQVQMPPGHPVLQFARTAVVDAKPISLQTLPAIRKIQLPEIMSGPWPGGTGAKALQITTGSSMDVMEQ